MKLKTLTAVRAAVKKQVLSGRVIQNITHDLDGVGARVLLVGGAVRDLFMGIKPKDIDIEVHGLTLAQLAEVLRTYGAISWVGKSFGVLRISGLDVDWSLPRKDSTGRKPRVMVDPHMPIAQAFRRRDLTINAMGLDLVTGELVDPFDGLDDLKNKRLRAPDIKRFIEDPLRFYRVMQFIGRFDMQPDGALNKRACTMKLSGVSRERIEQEYTKLLLRSAKPSLGIDWLRQVGRLQEVMPELAATIDVQQGKKWHPEGDVYEHTLQTLDAVAAMKWANDWERLSACWAAIGHDLGKVKASQVRADGHISAHGHELAGVPLAKKLLKRFTRDRDLIDAVSKIIRYHMQPAQLMIHTAKPAAFKRLALKLAPHVTMQLLGRFTCADKMARNPKKGAPLKTGCALEKSFLAMARKLQVLESVEKPLLLGRDVMDIVEPGPQMGELLKKAYAIQLDKEITDKAELKKLVIEQLKR